MADDESSREEEVPRPERGGETLVVTREESGLRLDQCLARRFPTHSRAFFQTCIREGRVRLNGHPCRPSSLVRAEQLIDLIWPTRKIYELRPEEIRFDVLFEDEHLLVINKPPGLVVHPAAGNMSGTLVHGLLFRDREHFLDMVDTTYRPGIVHRLDKDTSGAMVVAKNLDARRALKGAFKERSVEKTYLTIVLGEFGSIVGTIENRIGRHPVNRTKMAVLREGGKHALSKYRVLGTGPDCSLLEVRIFTGRTHQIRVHFSHLNHPVLGDGLYGGKRGQHCVAVPRQMLHAWKLVFPHPVTGVMRQYMAPLPDDFRQALEALGLPVVGVADDRFRRTLEEQSHADEDPP